jgi:hypothetical protein
MNTICKYLLFGLLQLTIIGGIQAQTVQPKLNQVDLMKQFLGTWKCELGRDTFLISDTRLFGTGMISKSRIFTKNTVLDSVIQLYGYDRKADKYIMSELIKSAPSVEICNTWFTSANAGEVLIINPDNAPLRFKFEFSTPDTLIQVALYNDKKVKVVKGVRMK